MTIPRRILLQVAIGASLVIAVSTAVTYELVYDNATERGLKHLETYVSERARREELGFAQVQANLALVRGQFLKRMEAPIPANYETKWNERFRIFPDGAWRSREEFVDGRKHATLWAHKNVSFTPELQTQILRAQDICNELLPAWVDLFPSLYFVFPGWANIGFDPRIPNWVWDTPANYDATQMEWFQLASPKEIPREGSYWSGVIEEPTTKMPIVSVYIPILKDGRFLGSIGHDLSLERLMTETTRSRLSGATHMVFRKDGRILAHPTKRQEILTSKGLLQMQQAEPALASLYEVAISRTDAQFTGFDPTSKTYFSVARLHGPDWFFLTTIPEAYLRSQAFQSAQWVLWSGLLSLSLVLVTLATILRRQIALPLAELTRATMRMSSGDIGARAEVTRDDELGALARAFNEMASRVAERDAELRAEKATLEKRVAERTVELARFASIAEATGDFFGFAAMDGKVLYVNPAGRRLLGLEPDADVAQLNISDVHSRSAYEELLRGAIPTAIREGACSGETKLRHRDGREITVSLMLVVPRTAEGTPMFLSAIMRDITAQKEAEAKLVASERLLRESEARFATAFRASPAMQSLIRGHERAMVEVNDTFLKKLGFTRDQVIGKTAQELDVWVYPEELKAFAQEVESKGFVTGREVRLRTRDGRLLTVLLSTQPVDIAGVPHFLSAGVDITERKEAEAKVLESERQLQNALAKERELNQLKSEFVSLVSHEFRTPLEIIMSSADNLDRYHERLPGDKRQHLLRTINKSVRRMSGMMEDVLVLGRFESNRIAFHPTQVDLQSFCERICGEVDSATGSRCPIALRIEEDNSATFGDETLLRHIFTNLLSNAVKYSAPGESIAFAIKRENNHAICSISDHGCGIPEADQRRIFQAFQRGTNVRQTPGTGLGLLIVKRCVDMHGGRITFDSIEGKGTTFTVTLPLFVSPFTPTARP